MRVRDLKRILEGVSDDTLVVIPSFDHSYTEATAGPSQAVRESRSRLAEYHGQEYVGAGMRVIDVVVVGAG